jgi:hypothetical protein
LSAQEGSLAVTRCSARPACSSKIGYCITVVVCKAAHFRPGAGVELDECLLAIPTKMVSTVVSLLLGIGHHGHGSGGSDCYGYR